jgi:hypothetical protein
VTPAATSKRPSHGGGAKPYSQKKRQKKDKKMFRRWFKGVSWSLIAIAVVIFLPVNVIAASAPMSLPQLALFDGADRERILLEGA